MIESYRVQMEDGQPGDPNQIRRISQLFGDAMSKIRTLIHGLHAIDLDNDELVPALRQLSIDIQNTYPDRELTIDVDAKQLVNLEDSQYSLHLFRMTQEAVSNAVRHGNATIITIQIKQFPDCVRLQIDDNGSGFDTATIRSNAFGLKIMQYRSNLMGAELEITTNDFGGTRIACNVPTVL